MDNHVLGIAFFSYFVFMFSTVCHEAGHAIAARLGGDSTAYLNGQVTLNPVPHIRQEPFGLGLLPLITLLTSLRSGGLGVIGFASAPYDPHWAVRYPRRAGWMAVAGPATNFSLALIAVALLKLGILGGVFEQNPESIEIWRLAVSRSPVGEGAVVFLSLLFFENLLLGVWNMLPIPPMDGFSAILLFLPAGRVTTFFELRGRLGMFYPLALLLLSGVFWSFFSPLLWSLIGFFFA